MPPVAPCSSRTTRRPRRSPRRWSARSRHVRLAAAVATRARCNAMARPALRRVGRRRRRAPHASPISIGIARSWRRRRPTRPGSRPCIGSTSPRCTATPSTNCATSTRPRTPPSARSSPALTDLGRFEERARPDDGEGASTFRVWLFQIARNVVAERRRRPRRRPEAPLDAAARVADAARPRGRRRPAATRPAAAWRAIDRLPGDRRRALVLRFVDEMSTAEIAGVLGRSEGAVRVLIHRALRSVARDLDDRDAVSRRSSGRDARDRGPRHRPLPRRAARRHRPDAPT